MTESSTSRKFEHGAWPGPGASADPTSGINASTAASPPLVALLEASKAVAFNINFARITGDPKAALFLSQLVYWTRRGAQIMSNEGWVFKSRDQLEIELGLGRHEQVTARSRLVELGLIQESKTGVPARLSYRVVPQVLGAYLAQLVRSEPVQWSLLDIRSDTEHIRSMMGRQFAFYRVLMNITGSCTSAIYLSKALAIQRRFEERAARKLLGQVSQSHAVPSERAVQEQQLSWDTRWFRMAADATQLDTGLSVAQQRDAKHKLCQIGVLHEAMMTHPRKQLYVRIDMAQLELRLRQYMTGTQPTKIMAACQNRPTENVDNSASKERELDNAASLRSCEAFTASQDCGIRGVKPFIPPQMAGSDARMSPPDVADCQNQSVWTVDNSDPVGQNSQTSWPVSASKLAGFNTPSWPVLAGLHARASRVRQDYKGEYRNTTTTRPETVLPLNDPMDAALALPPPPSSPVQPSAALQGAGSTDGNVVVVSLPEVEQQTRSDGARALTEPSQSEAWQSWQWPEQLGERERKQAARIVASLAKTGQLVDAQNIIDEFAGALDAGVVRSALPYLGGLVRRHQATPGGLVFERADEARKRRLVRQQIQSMGVAKPAEPKPAADPAASAVNTPVALSDEAKAGLERARALLRQYKAGRQEGSST